VGRLTGGMVHSINNRLCTISNHLQLLRLCHGNLAPELVETLAEIERHVERIAARLQVLSEYAREDAEEHLPLDVNGVIEELLGMLRDHPGYRHIRVLTKLTPNLPQVDLDRAELAQLLLELLPDPRTGRSEGGAVRITTRRVVPQGHQWSNALPGRPEGVPACAQAEDGPTGPLGDSPPPPYEKVWIEVALEDEGPGWGACLGLELCRRIVERHGGHFHLESQCVARRPGQADGRKGRAVILLPASRGHPMSHVSSDAVAGRQLLAESRWSDCGIG
jgi:signal transduction histidine kinase